MGRMGTNNRGSEMKRWDTSYRCGSVLLISLMAALALMMEVSARADGFRNPPEGASALGRAGVRVTEGDDLTAITHNPANLMDIKQAGVLPTATIGYSKRTFTAPNGISEDSKSPWTVLPAVYAGGPVKDGAFAAGVGISVPYGQASEWSEDGMFKYHAPYFAQMRSANVNPTIATRLGKDIAIGAGVDVMWSDLTFKQSMPLGPTTRMVFEGDGMAFGANVGITWNMTQDQRLALTYRSPMTVTYKGDFEMQNLPPPAMLPPGALPPGLTPGSDFETEMNLPSLAVLGYGIHLTKALRVEANVEWVEHSRNKAMDLDIGNNNPILLASLGGTSLPQNWKDTWTYGVGADYALCQSVTVRAGWVHLPSPVPEETLMPTLAEADKDILSVGIGLKSGRQTLDLGYAYSLSPDRTIDSPMNPINGTYEFDAHLFAVSYGYCF